MTSLNDLKDQIKGLHKPSRRELGIYGLGRLKKIYNIEGVDFLISDLEDVVDSGLFLKLFNVYADWKEPVDDSNAFYLELSDKSSLMFLADKYLDHDPIRVQLNLITYFEFYYFYPFLAWTYQMYLDRKLEVIDLERLFYSGIAEKIVIGLENFNEIRVKPEISHIFFKKLKMLKWQDRKTKKISRELMNILALFTFKESGINEKSFDGKIYHVILFIAGCNAVKNERNKITTEDVITAHKTFYKIIRTDISKLIAEKNSQQKRTSKGYLVCEKCKRYYQLQPEESPDDFGEECECGGKLKNVKNIKKW